MNFLKLNGNVLIIFSFLVNGERVLLKIGFLNDFFLLLYCLFLSNS